MKTILKIHTKFIIIIALLSCAILSCDKGNLPPMARLSVFPPIGDSLTLFEFSAGESADDRDYPKGLMCRWDFTSDGQWDTEYDRSKTATHQFINPGIYMIAVEVRDLDGLTSVARDTIEVIGMNREIDTLIDNRDGSRYRIVKIRERWWMAENLHYGEEIPVSRIQTNNGIAEMYRDTSRNSRDSSGGAYHWLEAMNYQIKDPKGICPDSWHIPTHGEWNALFAPYPYMYGLQYFGKGGLSNLNLDQNNAATRWTDGTFWWAVGWDSGFWASSYEVINQEYHPYYVGSHLAFGGTFVSWTNDTHILEGSETPFYFTLRCIKDKL